MQMFTVVDLFSCFFDMHVSLSVTIQMHMAMKQVQLLAGDPRTGSYDVIMYDVIAGHDNICVNNSSQNRGRAASRGID